MTEISCRYCKDPTTGMLVNYNECPEFVERMYEIKELKMKLKYPVSVLDMLIDELENELFLKDGRLFVKWLKANRFSIKTNVWFIEERFLSIQNDPEEKSVKQEIVARLKAFIIE